MKKHGSGAKDGMKVKFGKNGNVLFNRNQKQSQENARLLTPEEIKKLPQELSELVLI